MPAAVTGSLCTEQVTTVIKSCRSPRACEKASVPSFSDPRQRMIRWRGMPIAIDVVEESDDPTATSLRPPRRRGGAGVAVALLVNLGPVHRRLFPLVLNTKARKHEVHGVEAELDLQIAQ